MKRRTVLGEYYDDPDYDEDEYADEIFMDAIDTVAYNLAKIGFKDFDHEVNIQNGSGSVDFWAFKNGQRYSGSVDYANQVELIIETRDECNSYEEAVEKWAKQFTLDVASNLERD